MRLVLAMVLAGLVALPLSATAQDAEENATPEPSAEEPAPSSEPAPEEPATEAKPEEPALQLKLDSAGVDVAPSPLRTADGYTLEEMDVRVTGAGIGLGFSGAVLVSGGVMLGIGAADSSSMVTGEYLGLLVGGAILTIGGLVATIITGRMLAERKRDRDRLRAAHYGTPRRVQWDLAQSRLMF